MFDIGKTFAGLLSGVKASTLLIFGLFAAVFGVWWYYGKSIANWFKNTKQHDLDLTTGGVGVGGSYELDTTNMYPFTVKNLDASGLLRWRSFLNTLSPLQYASFSYEFQEDIRLYGGVRDQTLQRFWELKRVGSINNGIRALYLEFLKNG